MDSRRSADNNQTKGGNIPWLNQIPHLLRLLTLSKLTSCRTLTIKVNEKFILNAGKPVLQHYAAALYSKQIIFFKKTFKEKQHDCKPGTNNLMKLDKKILKFLAITDVELKSQPDHITSQMRAAVAQDDYMKLHHLGYVIHLRKSIKPS